MGDIIEALNSKLYVIVASELCNAVIVRGSRYLRKILIVRPIPTEENVMPEF